MFFKRTEANLITKQPKNIHLEITWELHPLESSSVSEAYEQNLHSLGVGYVQSD